MSDSESFIREVTEEVRRDRLYGLWKRYGPFVIGALVAVVAAAAGLQWWEQSREGAAQEAGGALVAALEQGDASARADALLVARDALAEDPARLAGLAAAASLAEAGRAGQAADLYDALAADPAASDAVAAFAAYRAAMLRAPSVGPAATEAALTPLAASDAPFRLLALEGRAGARLAAGDAEGARADIDAILTDPTATESLRMRALEMSTALGAPAGDG